MQIFYEPYQVWSVGILQIQSYIILNFEKGLDRPDNNEHAPIIDSDHTVAAREIFLPK